MHIPPLSRNNFYINGLVGKKGGKNALCISPMPYNETQNYFQFMSFNYQHMAV